MKYAGRELDLFSRAKNWNVYFSSRVSPFIGHCILEVGAGIGRNIQSLHNDTVETWISLEPDPELAARINEEIRKGDLPKTCRVFVGTLSDIPLDSYFDTILYIDVLEHIEDDAGEVIRASRHLVRGGHLIVLAPAHRFLFSPFDSAIGHHRRYNGSSLRSISPKDCVIKELFMLDSVGLLASLANRVALRKSIPSKNQVAFWDGVLVPLSRLLDPVTRFKIGKTIVVVWSRQ
jgi:SAM-dependent methyltransferase